jgi:mannose-1-phosphate guanylyltransferase
VSGDVLLDEVSGSLVMATSRTLAVAGLSDMVVIETPEAVLVLPLDRAQEVRGLAERARP